MVKALVGLPKMQAETECDTFCERNCPLYNQKDATECVKERKKAMAGEQIHKCVLLLQLRDRFARERWGLDPPRLGI